MTRRVAAALRSRSQLVDHPRIGVSTTGHDPRGRTPAWHRSRTTSRAAVVMIAALAATGASVDSAQGAVTLTSTLRRQIVASHSVTAPTGRPVTSAACITGRLSTVDRRWAAVALTDTNACVSRFGGATGEGVLVRRPTPSSPHWRRVGSVGDNCPRGDGGARSRVLVDLGCRVEPTTTTGALAGHRTGLAQRSRRVTWAGFDGVTFGERLADAARQLNGKMTCDTLPAPRCGVAYPGDAQVSVWGALRGENRTGRTVGSFQSGPGAQHPVWYPRGTFTGQSLSAFRRALGRKARPQRPEHNAAAGFYLVGPRGRTLWGWGDRHTGVVAIGLADSLAGARADWSREG